MTAPTTAADHNPDPAVVEYARRVLVDRAGNTVAEAVDGLPDTYQFIRDTRIRTQRATVTIGRYDTVDAVHAVALFAGTDDAAVVAATLDAERQQAERKSKAAQDDDDAKELRRRKARKNADRVEAAELYGDVAEVEVQIGDAATTPTEVTDSFLVESLWSYTRPQVLLYAKAKIGKSTLAHNVIAALLSGNRLFGRYRVETPAGRIGLIDTEMTPEHLRNEFGTEWPEIVANNERLATWSLGRKGAARQFDVTDPEVRQKWVDRLRTANVEVLIVDCLGPLLRTAGVSENEDAARFMEHIREVCDRAGVKAHLIVDHASSKQGNEGNGPRGDSKKQDTADALWKFSKNRDTGLFHLHVEGRDGEHTVDLERDVDSYRFRKVFYLDDPDYAREKDAHELFPVVRAAISDSPAVLSQTELRDAVGERLKRRADPPGRDRVRQAIISLTVQGCLSESRGERGAKLYALTGTEPVKPSKPVQRYDDGSFGGAPVPE
ncbi:Hypothetical protein CGLY_07345 [Corynebacterium glyciniphilum AJ 3170]|uniref:Uncharacterized protein n=1 Tax=Corynebacterium glyciniphilum AJ 3170 TaxID=1404245 RepID=X5DRJ6_9CORY|nr:AAA family ATPase [Corynebacterium glyciniphilum]AHW63914.1 Hypothetical protein CGLY_07345 [Corynebacterium glyciniphilum AJ 3170]